MSSTPPLRALASLLRRRLAGRQGLLRVASNTGWYLADRVIRGAVGVAFGILVARALGPSAFGQLGFAQAVTGITGVLALLGLETVVVRGIVRDPDASRSILGSAALLRLAGAAFGFVLSIGVAAALRPGDSAVLVLVAILSAGTLFQASDVIELYFQATSRFRLTATARLGACLLNALLRGWLLLSGAGVAAFAWALVFEMAAGALLLWVLHRGDGAARWQASLGRARHLIREAWPLAAAALLAMAYMRIDQIMVGNLLGSEALGKYMAAVRLTEMWYVVPIALSAAAFPHIVQARQQSEGAFAEAVFGLYRVLGSAALLLCIVLALFSDRIVAVLYGSQYAESAAVLRIYGWAAIPVFLGMASERYLIAAGRADIALARTGLGFATNIALNVLLVPRMGLAGAAWATAASYFVSVFSLLAWPLHRAQVGFMLLALLHRPRKARHVAG